MIVSPLNLLLYLSIESLTPALFSIGTGGVIGSLVGFPIMKVHGIDCRRIICSSNVPSVSSLELIWKSPSEADSKNPDRSHYHAVN